MKRVLLAVLKCFLNTVQSVFGVVVVVALSLACIKCCVQFALNHAEERLVVEAMPLLQKMVWPFFLLFVLFYFKSLWERILKEIPGLINRSYLPYSPQPPPFENGSGCKDIADVFHMGGSVDFSESEHRQKVDTILELIGKEYGVSVVSEAKVNNSCWRADGAFRFASQQYYVAVLPSAFVDRVSLIFERINEVLRHNITSVFIVYVYGDANVQQYNIAGRPENVIVRFGK